MGPMQLAKACAAIKRVTVSDAIVLQAFVRERIVSFSGESAFARRLNLAPSVVRNAAIAALTELALRGSELNSAADCGLIFRHDCL